MTRPAGVLRRRAARRERSTRGIELAAARACWPARSSCSASSAIRPDVAAGQRVSRSAISSWRRGCRSFSGAAFRTTSCSTSPSRGQAARARRARRAGARGCWPIRRARRSSTTSPGSGCTCATCAAPRRTRTTFPTSTTTCGRRSSARSSCSSAASSREDRSVLDLLTADYTFVNERLAQHYGIPNVYGSHFRRVALTDEARRGLLGKGGILLRDVARRSHVAGGARQVDSRQPARARRRRRRRPTCRRSRERGAAEPPTDARAAWSSTARTRRARAATR